MGVDIHVFLQVRLKTQTGSLAWFDLGECSYTNNDFLTRNYKFFAEIASIKGKSTRGLKPNGIPEDAGFMIQTIVERLKIDSGDDDQGGFGLSCMPLKQFLRVYTDDDAGLLTDHALKCHISTHYAFDNESIDNFRVIFYFDG